MDILAEPELLKYSRFENTLLTTGSEPIPVSRLGISDAKRALSREDIVFISLHGETIGSFINANDFYILEAIRRLTERCNEIKGITGTDKLTPDTFVKSALSRYFLELTGESIDSFKDLKDLPAPHIFYQGEAQMQSITGLKNAPPKYGSKWFDVEHGIRPYHISFEKDDANEYSAGISLVARQDGEFLVKLNVLYNFLCQKKLGDKQPTKLAFLQTALLREYQRLATGTDARDQISMDIWQGLNGHNPDNYGQTNVSIPIEIRI